MSSNKSNGGAKSQAAGSNPAAENKTEPAKKGKKPGIKVVSRLDGFRRGGRPWTAAPTVVALDEFNEEQLAQIRSEPNLIVQDVDIVAVNAEEE